MEECEFTGAYCIDAAAPAYKDHVKLTFFQFFCVIRRPHNIWELIPKIRKIYIFYTQHNYSTVTKSSNL